MKVRLATGTIALSALMLTSAALGGAPKPVQHIEVNASRFSFEPHEITVKKGDSVTITMHSTDVTHGLVIEELGIRTEVKKGQSEDLTLTPAEVGNFDGRCAHFCGKGHGSMIFTVHVVD
jgi:cytochrome c oxidase subunit II